MWELCASNAYFVSASKDAAAFNPGRVSNQGRTSPGKTAQDMGSPRGQVKLTETDIRPHVINAGHHVGITRQTKC